ncbi:hypothetical protein [Nocardia brasiliensis]|uniref:hypothetical protein n=1 Tax=Nocardia brasiliensis TaxID=37326 RepID=UPI002453995B|nr:hypothetical protein [Nocardia brasiliensis]
MSEQDQGDIFLRHRGAVLEALLTEAPTAVAGQAQRAQTPPEELVEPDILLPDGPNTEPTAPPRRQSVGEPRASDRIIALLNGTAPDSSAQLHYLPEEDPESGGRNVTSPPERSPSSGELNPTPSQGRFGSAQSSARHVLTHLKNPKVSLPLGAALALLLVLVLVTSGSKKQPDSAQLPVVSPSPTTAAAQPSTTGANTASSTLPVKSAVSHCPAGSTPGMDAFGGEPGKAWSCGRAFKIDGQVLTIELDKEYQIDSIGIVPGFDSVSADGVDQWSKYRTVSRVSYQFADADTTTYTQQTLDQRTLVVTKLNPPVRTSQVVLTVLASKGEPTVNTVAISSITITGR